MKLCAIRAPAVRRRLCPTIQESRHRRPARLARWTSEKHSRGHRRNAGRQVRLSNPHPIKCRSDILRLTSSRPTISFAPKSATLPRRRSTELKEADGKEKLVAAVKASFDFCGTALAKAEDCKARRHDRGFRRQVASREPGPRWLWPAAGPITTAPPRCISD